MPHGPSHLEALAQATPSVWHIFPPHSILCHLTDSYSSSGPQPRCPFLQRALPDHRSQQGLCSLLCAPTALPPPSALQ